MNPIQVVRWLYDSYYPLSKDDAMGIVTSCVLWTVLYIIVERIPLPSVTKHATLTQSQILDVKNRIVSIVHGIVLLVFSANEFYFFPGSCGDPNTTYEKRLIYCACGYFLYDFFAMAYYGLLDKAMSFHHWACVIGMSLPLTYGMSGNYVVQGMFVGEGSNTFMHARIILRHYGLRYTRAYETMEILFMLIYIFGRIIMGTYTTWSTACCQHNLTIVKMMALGLLVQSAIFIQQMIGILKKRFKEISDRKKLHIRNKWFEPLCPEELKKLGINEKSDKQKLII